ncbi:hypothetical protein LguiA_013416 [Lonicera macranthoides]
MEELGGRSDDDENKSCSKEHWRPAEDEFLRLLVQQYGARNWNFIAEHFPGRTGKSCRLRWVNQLNPHINKTPFTVEEEAMLLELQRIHGNKWSTIAHFFPGRTDNHLKNQYHIMSARRSKEIARLQSDRTDQHQPSGSTPSRRGIFQKDSRSPRAPDQYQNPTRNGVFLNSSPHSWEGRSQSNIFNSLRGAGSRSLGTPSYPSSTIHRGYQNLINSPGVPAFNRIGARSATFSESVVTTLDKEGGKQKKENDTQFIDFLGVGNSD